jgi:hypothetical protein
MVAGLPGTGIGGIFYILLAFTMPFVELYRLARGQSSVKRWRMVLMQVCNASGILGGVYVTGWLLARGLNFYRSLAATTGGAEATYQPTANVIPAASVYAAIATLCGLILMTYVLRFVLRNGKGLPATGGTVHPLPRAGRAVLPATTGRAAIQ